MPAAQDDGLIRTCHANAAPRPQPEGSLRSDRQENNSWKTNWEGILGEQILTDTIPVYMLLTR
ncbi:MAG: hypothetical protein L0331_14205 [Chloroflexi bacterium]|nr:hypothetical protein [Chloroflexota bacterium]